MDVRRQSSALLDLEARALLSRLDQIRPIALHETMVPAACLPPRASLDIERFLHTGRQVLRNQVREYLAWLRGPGRTATPEQQQYRFVLIRMRFNAILSQFDMFTEVVTQRSEYRTGVWLAGLDVVAADALVTNPYITDPPPLVCYLARGPGAAIRRAKTKMPGGDLSPAGIIRVPRERMVGHGIASSLVHEVGHQGAALLDLVPSLRKELAGHRARAGASAPVWKNWENWISEIVADFWSVATLGISSTLGLLAVVSLPRFFVFRPSGDDPHPIPYVRVLLSCAIGQELYPHPQWADMARTWKALYPVTSLPPERQREFALIEAGIPAFVKVLVNHRPASLKGRPLRETFPLAERQPARLLALHQAWKGDLGVMARQRPALVFAVIGQARAAGRIDPEAETQLVSALLRAWALRSSLSTAENVTTHRRALQRAS
ncbi:hypothetical protein [Nocardioides jiangxiensis]|uniref:HEXXH motif-containing protein n=1 Tax=Nocardioides jiangxiensis TaxID=3064524 RepID=A0ABT9AY06_9ACTN|nr:hypothetical protein [Nocardioides sp. WY-20]MDO7866773.1 hypothetical protein [Nocardioides sp. WY-20]